MTDLDPTIFILDEAGDPVGRWRANKDDSPDRLHAVPKLNRAGEPIMEFVPVLDELTGLPKLDKDGRRVMEERQEMEMLPLDHPRVIAALAEYGLYVENNRILGIDRETADGLGSS